MIIAEQINRKIQQLPLSLQNEVLNFIEFLLQKTAQRGATDSESETLTPEQKAQAWENWAKSHSLDTPVIFDDSREAIYEDA